MWCQDNNLSLNVIKTKEMIVDYKKRRTEHVPILMNGAVVEQVESFMFLGIHITNKLTWSNHTKTVVKRTTKPIPPQETENIWHGSSDPQKVLQLHHQEHPGWLHHCLEWQLLGLRPQGTTEGSVYGRSFLPSRTSIQGGVRNALKNVKESSHPIRRLFSLLPQGKRYQSLVP